MCLKKEQGMKLFKFFIFIFAISFFAAALGGCDRRPKAEKEAQKRAEAALPEISPPSQVKTDNAVIHAGTCSADSDCVAVFPSCCGEANPPYYINKLYKEDFISDYKEINKEDPCPKDLMCPVSYFGKAVYTRCKNNICIEALPLAATMKEPFVPAKLKEEAARTEAIKIIAKNRAALIAKEHNFAVPAAQEAPKAEAVKTESKKPAAEIKKTAKTVKAKAAHPAAEKKASAAVKADKTSVKTANNTTN